MRTHGKDRGRERCRGARRVVRISQGRANRRERGARHARRGLQTGTGGSSGGGRWRCSAARSLIGRRSNNGEMLTVPFRGASAHW